MKRGVMSVVSKVSLHLCDAIWPIEVGSNHHEEAAFGSTREASQWPLGIQAPPLPRGPDGQPMLHLSSLGPQGLSFFTELFNLLVAGVGILLEELFNHPDLENKEAT